MDAPQVNANAPECLQLSSPVVCRIPDKQYQRRLLAVLRNMDETCPERQNLADLLEWERKIQRRTLQARTVMATAAAGGRETQLSRLPPQGFPCWPR